MRERFAWPAVLLIAGSSPLAAQSPARVGPRSLMEREVEIILARSAAPAPISATARAWVLTSSGYVVADSGTSPVDCYVGRPWVGAIEPHCFDAEGAATVFPIQRFRVEQLMSGKANVDVERAVAEGIASGKFRLPTRPAMTYMMSAKQDLVSGEGNAVGRWEPHLMIYFPYLTGEQTGLFAGFVPGVGFVENPGTALSALIIPLKEFVPVAEAGKK